MSSVQSINRAFEILEFLASRPSTISQLSRQVDLPNTTVTRILRTLSQLGVVTRNEDGTFELGPTAQRLGQAASRGEGDIRSIDQARLAALTSQIGEIAGLSVRDGRNVLYIAQVPSPHEVQVRDWTGERVPLHVVSSGLVFLAHATPADVDEYLATDLERLTPATETDPARLRERLERVKEHGVAWTKEEFHTGINSIAAPIYNSNHEVAATLHSHGPSYRFPGSLQDGAISATLKQAAARLSHSIGWTGRPAGTQLANDS